MNKEYDFKKIEEKWQKKWEGMGVSGEKPDYYVLSMWPYPSGRLHMGHLRNYCIGDVLARFQSLEGKRVLHPMGWDAFGLPAENAAMERSVHPQKWTLENISHMRAELKSLGFSFDWSKEETSCLPEYYRHEQAMFLDFLAKRSDGTPAQKYGEDGIAYKKESVVNWDPVDNTVLANEQVVEGRGWRSGALVEKRLLSQWFLRVSDFAGDLLEGLKTLKNWPEKVKLMQENWIGKSEGSEIDFEIDEANFFANADTPHGSAVESHKYVGKDGNGKSIGVDNLHNYAKIRIFTTRPETLHGASFVAVSYGHPLARAVARRQKDAAEFVKECEKGSTKAEDIDTAEKKGFFTGIYAKNPVNGGLLPVYIANFVLMDYGTGALFGCPAHDARDFEFALKYRLPVKRVIFPEASNESPKQDSKEDTAFKPIETPNFIIRAFEDADAQALTETLLELNGDPYWIQNPLSDAEVREEAARKLRMYQAWQREFGFSRWAVIKKDTGEFIGGAGLCFFNKRDGDAQNQAFRNTDIELGYWFLKRHHGKGYAKEVVSGIMNWAEKRLPVLQIVAVAHPSNIASHRVLLGAGFAEAGVSRNPKEGDEMLFYKSISPKIEEVPAGDGVMVESGELNGLSVAEARARMFEKFGKKTNFRLKDWGVSRQRYWGCPIPIINCPSCGIVPVEKADLPVKLPEDIVIEAGENPLKKHPTWRHVSCPKCGEKAERETDTLDTFFESSWYFLRFCSAKREDVAFEAPRAVDEYIGGIEHAILHLLYARFFTRALKKCGYDVPFEEPFKRLTTQGMVCHKTFQDPAGKWLTPEEAAGRADVQIGASIKMSKSKKNVVEPAKIVREFGADTARFFMMSDTPPERDLEWMDDNVAASFKFLKKLWDFGVKMVDAGSEKPDETALRAANKALEAYKREVDAVALNKAIAKIRELSNFMFDEAAAGRRGNARLLLHYVLLMMMPFAPHISSEMLELLGCDSASLPTVDAKFLQEDFCKVAVQINGKLRATVEVKIGASQDEAEAAALSEENVQKNLEGKKVVKKIYVPNKIISFVVQ